MHQVKSVALVLAAALVFLGSQAHAQTKTIVDFETVPVEPTGPSFFSQAGPEKDITAPGVATFTGGVILGDEDSLPAQSYGSAPNVYATASTSIISGADPSLQSTLTVNVDPSFTADEISFPLFNGNSVAVSYQVNAYSGSALVGTQQYLNIPDTFDSGFVVVDLSAPDITQLTISPVNTANGWDFSIDTVAFNERVPEPSSLSLLIIAGFGLLARRRSASACPPV